MREHVGDETIGKVAGVPVEQGDALSDGLHPLVLAHVHVHHLHEQPDGLLARRDAVGVGEGHRHQAVGDHHTAELHQVCLSVGLSHSSSGDQQDQG